MTIDLQEQLRDIADTLVGCEWNHPLCSEETCRSAAAQIEQMTLENERLRGELHKTSQGLYATGRAEIEKLRQQLAAQMVEIERLREQLREQTKSFCTHCGRLFPKGRDGIAAFREHIAECNEHPLHPMAKQLDECRRLLRDVSVVEEKGVRGDICIHVTQQWLREAARAAGGGW